MQKVFLVLGSLSLSSDDVGEFFSLLLGADVGAESLLQESKASLI